MQYLFRKMDLKLIIGVKNTNSPNRIFNTYVSVSFCAFIQHRRNKKETKKLAETYNNKMR